MKEALEAAEAPAVAGVLAERGPLCEPVGAEVGASFEMVLFIYSIRSVINVGATFSFGKRSALATSDAPTSVHGRQLFGA